MEKLYLGLEIGGTKLQLVLGDQDARVLERIRLTVHPGGGAAGIQAQISDALQKILPVGPVATGVGFGGPVDWQQGRICLSHQIEGWSGFDLAGWLHARTGTPVRIENDANAAALAEAKYGAGTGYEIVLYVTLGSGVGAGLVADGRIYHGASPGEAEIGHIRLDRQGTTLESRCSGWAVDERIRTFARRHPESRFARLAAASPGAEARSLPAALSEGNAEARQLLSAVADDLAFGLSHAVHLFHPQVIVLGGGLSLVGDALRLAVAEALPAYLMQAFRPGPPVRLSRLGEDAVPVGALLLARNAAARA